MGTRYFEQWKGYNFASFRKDLIAGFVVGVIAIPLGMAFAIAVGVKPEYGIYTTIIAGILVSIFGGSRFQIAGPTGAFIPILLGVTIQYGYENLLIAGFMAGVFLLLMGVLRLGSYIKFIPRSVTIGFTSGIAVIIFTGQIGNFLGLEDLEKHEYLVHTIQEIGAKITTFNPYALVISLLSLLLILVTPKWFPKVPGSLIAIVISTIVSVLFFEGKVATIGSEFGGIPNTLPTISMPELSWDRILMLIQPALIIAALGAIESLLSAVVADGMAGTRHNSNRELVGQGVANMVVPLFGGIPATGAIARTATNIKTGAVTSLSGVIHGVVVLVVILLFAPYASHIPLASMAPVLMMVAWNMSGRKEFLHVLRTTRGDAIVLVTTFLLTVFTNLAIAVQVGLVLAFILFVKNMSDVQEVQQISPDPSTKHRKMVIEKSGSGRECPQVSLFTVEGPLFFGVAQLFEKRVMDTINLRPKVLILRMSRVPFLDATGEDYLSSVIHHFRKHGGVILITGIQKQPLEVLKKSNLYEVIGRENFFRYTYDAIHYATKIIDHERCKACRHFAFHECNELSLEGQPARTQKLQEATS